MNNGLLRFQHFRHKVLMKTSHLRWAGLGSQHFKILFPLLLLLVGGVPQPSLSLDPSQAQSSALQIAHTTGRLNAELLAPFSPSHPNDFLNDELSARFSNNQKEFEERIKGLEFSFSESQVEQLKQRLQNINRIIEIQEQMPQTESLIDSLQGRLLDLESTAPLTENLMDRYFSSAHEQTVEIQGFQLPSKREWLTRTMHDFHLLAREVMREYDNFFPSQNNNPAHPHLQQHFFQERQWGNSQNPPQDPLEAHRNLVHRAIDRLVSQGHFVWFERYPNTQSIGPKHYIHQAQLFQSKMSHEQQQNYRSILYEQAEGIFVDEDRDPFWKSFYFDREPNPFWNIRPVEDGDLPSIEQLFYRAHTQEIREFERAVRYYNKSRQTRQLLSSLIHFDPHLPYTRERDLRHIFNTYCANQNRFDKITGNEYPFSFLEVYNFHNFPIKSPQKNTSFHLLSPSICSDLVLVFHKIYYQRIENALGVFIPAMHQLLKAFELVESWDHTLNLIINNEETLSRLLNEYEQISGKPFSEGPSSATWHNNSSDPSEKYLLTESITQPINDFLYNLWFSDKLSSLSTEIQTTQNRLQSLAQKLYNKNNLLEQNPLGLATQTAYLIEKISQVARLLQDVKKQGS